MNLLGASAGDVCIQWLALNDNPDGSHSAVYLRVIEAQRQRGLDMWRTLIGRAQHEQRAMMARPAVRVAKWASHLW